MTSLLRKPGWPVRSPHPTTFFPTTISEPKTLLKTTEPIIIGTNDLFVSLVFYFFATRLWFSKYTFTPKAKHKTQTQN